MTKIVCVISILSLFITACKKEDPPVDETIFRANIAPKTTDIAYDSDDKEHLVFYNNEINTNKLLLFIGGTFSNPTSYMKFSEHAADLGFHVINIAYPNSVAAASLKTSDDVSAFDNYRDELCFGNPVSDAVDIDELNAIVTRVRKLLIYLNSKYPSQNWAQYLIGGNSIDWNKIVIAGHSQGAGHACYIAKSNLVHRVLMFSGPNDYSTHFDAPGNWLSASGVTPTTSHFAFLHLNDEVVPYEYQLANIRAIGVIGEDDSSILMDDLNGDYVNKNVFHTEISAITEHGSTLGGNSKLPPFWTYLLGEH